MVWLCTTLLCSTDPCRQTRPIRQHSSSSLDFCPFSRAQRMCVPQPTRGASASASVAATPPRCIASTRALASPVKRWIAGVRPAAPAVRAAWPYRGQFTPSWIGFEKDEESKMRRPVVLASRASRLLL